jgi:AAA family ATP:ADP antiporter
MGFVPAYGWLGSRLPRQKLIVAVILFFIVCLELFYVASPELGLLRVPNLGFIFFVWVGIFSLATIAQFWSYANDLYSKQAGERLFPLIAVGMTAGGPVGSWIAKQLFEAGVSPYTMLHIAAALLVVHLGLYRVIDRSECLSRHDQAHAATQKLGSEGGFALVLKSPYLRLVALLLVLLNIVNTTGEYILGRSVVAAANAQAALSPTLDKGAYIGGFYGEYFFWVNIATILIQAFLVSRIVRYLGFRGVLLALPIVALGTYGIVAAGAGFVVLRWAKTAENATDYSVMNTARQMLWLPTTRTEKYKAKQALDTFFVRAGDVLSAGVVFAGTQWLGLGIAGFAGANIAFVAAWLFVAWRVIAWHRRLSEQRRIEPGVSAG